MRDHVIPGSATVTYVVFDESGAWITELQVPAVGPVGRPAVVDVGHDYVLIREEDDLGIQYYARYDLIKPGD